MAKLPSTDLTLVEYCSKPIRAAPTWYWLHVLPNRSARTNCYLRLILTCVTGIWLNHANLLDWRKRLHWSAHIARTPHGRPRGHRSSTVAHKTGPFRARGQTPNCDCGLGARGSGLTGARGTSGLRACRASLG